jgi:hypothetical protein
MRVRRIPAEHRSETKGRTAEVRNKVVPKGKATFRSFSGQRHSAGATSKRGGGGRFNWGNALDGTEDDVDWDDLVNESTRQAEDPPMTFSQRIRSASIASEEEQDQDQGTESPDGVEQEMQPAQPVWGQQTRIDAMKDRLLALEREKIAQMAPERLELMNLLADHGQNVDENTLSALLMWKRQT